MVKREVLESVQRLRGNSDWERVVEYLEGSRDEFIKSVIESPVANEFYRGQAAYAVGLCGLIANAGKTIERMKE